MTRLLLRHRSLKSDLPFIVLTGISWLFFAALLGYPSVSAFALFCFALLSSGLTYLSLNLLGYFNVMRLIPRTSDFLLVLLAVPLSGAFTSLIVCEWLKLSTYSLAAVLIWSPLVAVMIFSSHFLLVTGFLRKSRRKMVLDVPELDRRCLIEAFEVLNRGVYLEYLSRADLTEHLLSGKIKEIDLIVISKEMAGKFDDDTSLLRAHLFGVPIIDVRRLLTNLTGRVDTAMESPWGYLTSATPQTPFLRMYFRCKRWVEPIVAVALTVCFLPLMLLIAFAIRLESRGPILYRQTRTGYLGRNFTLVKFRSMVSDSEPEGPKWARPGDSRITRVGEILRATRMDELPQLWNVICGHMSFIGPRPERPEIYRELKREIPLFSLRTIVRPGITGWAQIIAGYAASVEESRTKLEYDLYYIKHMSPRLDVVILLKTILVAISGSKEERKDRELRLVEASGS